VFHHAESRAKIVCGHLMQFTDNPLARGPWNEGHGPWPNGEQWVYFHDSIRTSLNT